MQTIRQQVLVTRLGLASMHLASGVPSCVCRRGYQASGHWQGSYDALASCNRDLVISMDYMEIMMHERPIGDFVPGLQLVKRLPSVELAQLWPVPVTRRGPRRAGAGRPRADRPVAARGGRGGRGRGRGRGRVHDGDGAGHAVAPVLADALPLEDKDGSDSVHSDGAAPSIVDEAVPESVSEGEEPHAPHVPEPLVPIHEMLAACVSREHECAQTCAWDLLNILIYM
jgi:hypothetical protein